VFTCVICRFDVPLDDGVAPTENGLCVCLRCFARETGSERAMEPALRAEVIAALEEAAALGSL